MVNIVAAGVQTFSGGAIRSFIPDKETPVRIVILLLLCLAVPHAAHAAGVPPAQGLYTGDNPAAPYTGAEPFRFEAALNVDTGEFCITMAKKEDAKTICYSVTAKPDGGYLLDDGKGTATLQVPDAKHLVCMQEISSGNFFGVYLTWKGDLPRDQALDTGASLRNLGGLWRVDRSKTRPDHYEKFGMQNLSLVVDSAGMLTLQDTARGKKWQYSEIKEKKLPGRFVFGGENDKGVEMRAYRDNSISMGKMRDRGVLTGVMHFVRVSAK